jgi:lipopolysaccharide/colanic/teichoic acid biosynthesis glycosyltransferase
MPLPALFARYPISRQTLVVIHDVAAVTVSLPLAVMLRDSAFLDGPRLLYVLSCLPTVALTALLAILLLGSYRTVWRYMGMAGIVRLARFVLLAILLFYTAQFLINRVERLPRSAPPIHFLVAMFLLIGARIAYGEWCRWTDSPADRPHRQPLLLIGAGDGAALFIQMLAQRRDAAYEAVGILCDDMTRHRRVDDVPILGGLDDLDAVLANLRVQGMTPARLVVTRPHHELGRNAVYRVMERAHRHRIPVEQLPDLMRFRGDNHAPLAPPASDAPASPTSSAADPAPDSSRQLYPRLKRAVDIAAAATILLLASPLLALAALAVAAFIQRPVLFVQIRPGLNRRPFRLLKLRTMRDPIGPDGRPRTDAARTPRAGRLLRRTRLDELPQFWNVLAGDMAIIGPRPLLASDLDAMPDHGVARSRTRPGITGWAQVNGGYQLPPGDKLALDLWYTENASLALDARIVWRTILMMLLGERRHPEAIADARAALQPTPATLSVRAAE